MCVRHTYFIYDYNLAINIGNVLTSYLRGTSWLLGDISSGDCYNKEVQYSPPPTKITSNNKTRAYYFTLFLFVNNLQILNFTLI